MRLRVATSKRSLRLRAAVAAKAANQKPTPHRFRHTFARRLLQDGNSIDDVAMALGGDPKTVALHYSAWVVGAEIVPKDGAKQSQPQ
jgi:integrase